MSTDRDWKRTATPGSAGFGTRWQKVDIWLLAAATVVPFIDFEGTAGSGGRVLALGSWAVFVVDLILQLRADPGYLRTRDGRVDAAIVVLTFPFWIFEPLAGTQILQTLRVVRLIREMVRRRPLQRFVRRIAGPGLVALVALLTAAAIVDRVEPAEAGFDSFAVSLWWALVTLTTVGYGDLVPVTSAGRTAAAVLMIVGIGLLGALAASMSGLFDLSSTDESSLDSVSADVKALREQVADLGEQIARLDRS